MTTDADGWRTLAPDELAAEPDARLGGAIAMMFGVAVLLLLPLPILIYQWFWSLPGAVGGLVRLAGDLFSADLRTASMAYGVLQILSFMAWAGAFAVAVIFRSRSVAVLAGLLFTIALLLGPLNQMVRMIVMAGGSDGLFAAASQLPHLLVSFVAVVAFWAYLRDGRRPNLYFGKRVRV